MTAHQFAQQLLAGPDLPIFIRSNPEQYERPKAENIELTELQSSDEDDATFAALVIKPLA